MATSKAFIEALKTGDYICSKCGATMFFEDEKWRDVLICPKCGHEVDIEFYGLEDEDFEDIYPTEDELND